MGSSMKIRLGRVVPVMGGVRQVLKSSGVASMLGAQAARAAARANSMCESQMKRAGARYASETVQRGYTAGGLVYPANKFARIDNYRHNTMKKATGA